MNESPRTLGQVLDEARLGGFQIGVIVLCFLLTLIDGFDTQNIAFVAPALRGEWGVPPNAFGVLFSAGLIGTMVGAMVLGPLGDRVGRRPMILLCALLFSVMSLLSATADSVQELQIYRFIGGLGLGGLLPNAIALVAEYSPKRIRSTMVVTTFLGFPMGAVIGGMASAYIIPAFGWRAVFVLGGVLPLLVLAVAVFRLPESVQYMAISGRVTPRFDWILGRLAPELDQAGRAGLELPQRKVTRQPVKHLFMEGRAAWTLLLWLLTACALLLTYFMVHWIPLVLVDAGIPQDKAIKGVALMNLGGIFGSLAISRISDKRGPYLAMAFAVGLSMLFIASVGLSVSAGVGVVLLMIFLVGVTFVGAQLNISALAANNYPPRIRSAGTGWSMAIGRVGSIIGPLIGGVLVARGLDIKSLFFVSVIPAAISLVAVLLMAKVTPSAASREE